MRSVCTPDLHAARLALMPGDRPEQCGRPRSREQRRRSLMDASMGVLSSPKLCSSGFLDVGALRNVIAEHASGADYSRLRWGLTLLELSLP